MQQGADFFIATPGLDPGIPDRTGHRGRAQAIRGRGGLAGYSAACRSTSPESEFVPLSMIFTGRISPG